MLKDGSDSVALGALNRVYLNIGLFSEEWLLDFNALVGGKRVTPIEIAVARKNSTFWQATEAQTLYMAQFLLNPKVGAPHHLRDAPGGSKYLTEGPAAIETRENRFRRTLRRCIPVSSQLLPPGSSPGNCAGPDYLTCWNDYWAWTKTEDFKARMRKIVLADDFLDNNFLSNDARVPVTLLHTNACSPLATNGIAGNIWDNFTSQSYKDLPSVGAIRYYHPVAGGALASQYASGWSRLHTSCLSRASLVHGAFFLNNAVGQFNAEPSVKARMESFQKSIEQMCGQRFAKKIESVTIKIPGKIDRTTQRVRLSSVERLSARRPEPLLDPASKLFPYLFTTDSVQIGPIPRRRAGRPVSQSEGRHTQRGHTNQAKHDEELLALLLRIKHDLKAAEGQSDEQAPKAFSNLVQPLMKLSRCPDFIVNRGHYSAPVS